MFFWKVAREERQRKGELFSLSSLSKERERKKKLKKKQKTRKRNLLTPVVDVGDDEPHPHVESQALAQLRQDLVAGFTKIVPVPPEEDGGRAADPEDRTGSADGRRRRKRKRRERAGHARSHIHGSKPLVARQLLRQRAQTVEGKVVGGQVEQVAVEEHRSDQPPPLARADRRVDFRAQHGQPLPRQRLEQKDEAVGDEEGVGDAALRGAELASAGLVVAVAAVGGGRRSRAPEERAEGRGERGGVGSSRER